MFSGDLRKLTLENTSYRKILFTGKYSQLVLMSIPVGKDIELEIHQVDQFFNFVSGKGKIIVANQEIDVKEDSAIVVPHNTYHQVINVGNVPLKLYTIYSPPQHIDKKKLLLSILF